MKKVIILLGILILASVIIGFLFLQKKPSSLNLNNNPTLNATQNNPDAPLTEVIAENLDTPWGIAFLPASLDQGGEKGNMLVTERKGTVRLVSNNKLQDTPVATLANVKEIGEGGLLGIALDPEFMSNNYIYFYYTYGIEGNNTKNRVVRMTYKDGTLTDEKTLVDNIPGGSNHNGGRIKWGPDGYLYVTTGDAQDPTQAQSKDTLGGKILRITKDGKAAPGNPFAANASQGQPFASLVYSYGHRNPQGIAWDNAGNLWETEHGRSGVQSGLDELNKIEPGKNYGWPDIEGSEARTGMVTPNLNSTASVTWAPGGTAIIGDTLYLTGLRGQSLYSVNLTENPLKTTEHFKGEFGRIREVIAGQDGMLYITTSNNDGRGVALPGDDKIIRVNPAKL